MTTTILSQTGETLATVQADNLRNASLPGANLRRADLYGADMSGANLVSALLYGADMRGANLFCANLRGADMRDADLRDVGLYNADLSRADLTGAATAIAQRLDGYMFLLIGDIVHAGCRRMTIADYRQHVAENYPGTPKAAETLRILDYLSAAAHAANHENDTP